MIMRDNHSGNLRVSVPTVEPDEPFLARLSELSRTAPAPRHVAPRVATVVASAAALSTIGWAAGAIPGVPSPFEGGSSPEPAPPSQTASVRPGPVERTGASSGSSASSGPETSLRPARGPVGHPGGRPSPGHAAQPAPSGHAGTSAPGHNAAPGVGQVEQQGSSSGEGTRPGDNGDNGNH